MKITFVLTVLACLASLFAAGDACDNVPSMTMDDACLQSCNTHPGWYKLCHDTLRIAPSSTAEVTDFAVTAARQATQRYEDTIATMNQMLGAGNLPADERSAVDHCKVKYGDAHGLMVSIADQMTGCDLTQARQEYVDAQVAVGSCQDGLWSYQSLPLYAMVTADLDLTMVAYELGALIVGK